MTAPEVLVGGVGGSGTRLVFRLVAPHFYCPSVNASGDSPAFLGMVLNKSAVVQAAKGILDRAYIDSCLAEHLGDWDGTSSWAAKQAELQNFIPSFEDFFPGKVRYIHVVRDVLAVRKRYRRQGEICAAWGIKDSFQEYWRETNDRIRSFAAALMVGRYLEVQYEDLVLTPEVVIRRMEDFLGLRFSKESVGDFVASLRPIRVGGTV